MKRSYSAAFRSQDKLLVVQRAADEDFLPNYWELPGGGAEPEEMALEALGREIQEELGLNLADFTLGHPYYYFTYGERREETHFVVWSAQEIVPTLNPAEHQSYKWVTTGELAALQISDQLRESCKLALLVEKHHA